MKRKRYQITYFKKHYLHRQIIAVSKEEATSLAWANCPKDSWVETIEELKG